MVELIIESYNSEDEFGTHAFLCVPRKGEIIEFLYYNRKADSEDLVRGRVEEVCYLEVDAEGNGGDIHVYVSLL